MNMGQTEWKYRRDLAPKIEWVKTAGQLKFKGAEVHDKQMLKKLEAGENHWEKLSLDQLEELKQWALEKENTFGLTTETQTLTLVTHST